ncbi:TadE/TadG family type IV pilus assembly protein [Cochlodiniinecator piscidefendens]|uniref:TadE/TadG family type IV pilus assembly protein n=1 Tax=Cochlodiniinecator piscidefendens TaxID=2715756 RepID=UPI0014081B83|nr:TadE/TadG family type IV pilus assembly protein [Cochlodiniinecator piscidefendens]
MTRDSKTKGLDGATHRSASGRRNRGFVTSFAKDEDGSIIIFSLYMFILMVMIGGIAVDVMRFESRRAQLQNTLDRAILAAADLDQTLDPESVVEDYFDKAGLSDYLTNVTVDQGLAHRTVSATSSTPVNTMFMGLLGVDELTAPAQGTAEERKANVEISMVLDISGSMGRNNKIQLLRDSASEFVESVIGTNNEGLTSVSLIPYTAQVNAGSALFNQIVDPNAYRVPNHSYSHCIEFETADFNQTGLDFSSARRGNNRTAPVSGASTQYFTYEQGQHFEWSSSSSRPIRNPGCPDESYEEIVTFSEDISDLQDTIGQYRARANTAIHIGMKWGTILLDPTTNGVIRQMVAANQVDDAFENRPAAWNDTETLKVVVLMTDGENVSTYRIRNSYYNSTSEYAHWNQYSLWNYLYRYVSSYNRSRYYELRYTSSQADSMLSNICDAAKDNNITVFTIGFEVGNHGANVMRNCASSPSHFFRVEGLEIGEAFNSIARQINQLRLTQ